MAVREDSVKVADLTGGLNLRDDPRLLKNNEAQKLTNFDLDSYGIAKRRKDWYKWKTGISGTCSHLLGEFEFVDDENNDSVFVVAFFNTSQSGISFNYWANGNTTTKAIDTTLFGYEVYFLQYKNHLFFTTGVNQGILSWDSTTKTFTRISWGLARRSAPTAESTGAGNVGSRVVDLDRLQEIAESSLAADRPLEFEFGGVVFMIMADGFVYKKDSAERLTKDQWYAKYYPEKDLNVRNVIRYLATEVRLDGSGNVIMESSGQQLVLDVTDGGEQFDVTMPSAVEAGNKIMLYRTKTNGTEFFRHTGVAVTSASTVHDNLRDDELTAVPLTTLDLFPPPICRAVIAMKGRIYLGGRSGANPLLTQNYKSRVYATEAGSGVDNVQQAKLGTFVEVSDDDGEEINAFAELGGNLYIFKETKTFMLPGGNMALGSAGIREISNEFGCIEQKSIQHIKGGIILLTKDGFKFFDGNSFQDLSYKIFQHHSGTDTNTGTVKDVLKGWERYETSFSVTDQLSRVKSVIYKDQYIVLGSTYAGGDLGVRDIMLIFDLKKGFWRHYDVYIDGLCLLKRPDFGWGLQDTPMIFVYGGGKGSTSIEIYVFEKTPTGGEENLIYCDYESPLFGMKDSEYRKEPLDMRYDIKGAASSITLTINGTTVPTGGYLTPTTAATFSQKIQRFYRGLLAYDNASGELAYYFVVALQQNKKITDAGIQINNYEINYRGYRPR